MEADPGAAIGQVPAARGRHIKKRSLKNKALSVAFNEKDLKDFVTGFHKRKKKRRKEARQKQEVAERRQRIQERKRRKLEREYAIHGDAPPASGTESNGDNHEQDEEAEPMPSVSGTMLYDNGNIKVTVTTSEISRAEVDQDHPSEKSAAGAVKKHNIPVSKKSSTFKKAGRQKSRPKLQKKREKKKGRNNKKRL
ncbi:hypothetical protein Dimus_032798 [Dionaea muscipula]